MATYYVNERAQANGDHEIHKSDCIYLPSSQNRKYLGEFNNCEGAVREAKRTYTKTNGCKTCSEQCHTS